MAVRKSNLAKLTTRRFLDSGLTYVLRLDIGLIYIIVTQYP